MIRARLENLGRPSFRLSCREADWFGTADQDRLKLVSPDNQLTILHLDPLTDTDIVEILNHNPQVTNATEFMQWAEQKGLNELLSNPQVLDMLVKAVDDGNWPDTRSQTFEMACQTIIREHNREHIDATRSQPADENQQLNAAGLLCAVQLISGNAGYTLTPDKEVSDFPYLGAPAFDNMDLLHKVARTKLFTAPVEGRITPIHRHVAEYLAARYIAARIEHEGLPIGRILALLTGEDGIVIAELRGLSAWLAALCKSQRSAIIERDPLGVVLYGDVQNFTTQEKRRVLDGLRREAARYPWFRSSHWAASPFGALATSDMEEEFCNILTASDRSETHQALADCVLDAMTHGAKYPSLDNTLLDIIRDSSWWPGIRRQALKVIVRNVKGKPDTGIQLKTVLEEILNGTVVDLDDNLLGYLLTIFYPRSIPASEILDYLHAPKRRNHTGGYLIFWCEKLLDQSSDSDVRILLDELTSRLDVLQPILGDHHLRDFTSGLLAQGLKTYGEPIDPARLYGWLAVGLDKFDCHHSGEKTAIDSIRFWLESHPATQKAVITIGLDRCEESENFRYCMHQVKERLYYAKPPIDYGVWCLEQALSAKSDHAAEFLILEAADAVIYQSGDAGLSLEHLEDFAEQYPQFNTWLADRLVCTLNPKEQEFNTRQRLRKREQSKNKQEWLSVVKSYQKDLREGRVSSRLLHDLATAYFGHFPDSKGDTPIDRLRNFMGHDEELVQSVFEGLHRSMERDDIPNVKDIIALNTKGETYLLSRPFLAELEEITQATPENDIQLSDDQIRQAVAFYLVDGTGEDLDWHQSLLASHPELVAEVMTTYISAALRSKKQHISGLYELANNDAYAQVARLASLTMLNAFPVRSTNQQLISLDELLKAALRYANREELLTVIENNLDLRSMNVAQRVRWLAAGLIIAPKQYLTPLADFTKGEEKRVQHLAGFIANGRGQWSPLNDLPISALGLLIRLIGEFFAPYALEEADGVISPAMNAANLLNRLISRLGSQPGKEVTDTLEALSADPVLSRWQPALHHARFEQRAVRREASFHHPDIHQVSETLNNRTPANAGDLAALTIDVLQELAYQIRNGNTDDFRQYWNEGPRRQLDAPKHEDACRDALLSDLQQRFALLGIDAQKEGYYADNKRADIRVAFGGADGFEIPIEIKKNSHRNLWRAIHDQLITKYTREPRAHGFGIYVVFWFGSDKTQPAPSGPRPQTAEDLEKRLQATLSADESRKISICVIDVAPPD